MIELRRITAADWELWRAVRLRALAEAPYAFGSTLAHWQGSDLEARWRSRLDDVALNVVALTVDGSAVGQVSGTAADGDGRVELISMWVAPEARGTGAGEALVGEVLRWAAGEEGAPAVVLSVKEGNERAIALYRRLGFEQTDEAADEGELRMVRTLD